MTRALALIPAAVLVLGVAIVALAHPTDRGTRPDGVVRFVDDDGGECPAAYRTIQAAVDAAEAGDFLVVCRGNYDEVVDPRGRRVSLDVHGEGSVTLDGKARRVVIRTAEAAVTVAGPHESKPPAPPPAPQGRAAPSGGDEPSDTVPPTKVTNVGVDMRDPPPAGQGCRARENVQAGEVLIRSMTVNC